MWREFLFAHPIISLMAFYVACYFGANLIVMPWSRFLRHLNIRARGWPPPHLDADGDPIKFDDTPVKKAVGRGIVYGSTAGFIKSDSGKTTL